MGTVALCIRSGFESKPRREEVPCKFVGKFFAVHRPYGVNDQRRWQLTHRPSGYGAGRYRTRKEAIERGEWLEKRGKRAGVNWASSSIDRIQRGSAWKELQGAVARLNKKQGSV